MSALKLPPLQNSLVFPAKTTIAAVVALVVAQLVGLPEAYWAPITAVVVVQSDFGTSLTTGWQRLAGTALGAFVGALLATYLGQGVIVFALGVFGVGLIAAALRLGRPANRFAAITIAIVLLITRDGRPWIVALHRFLEVSVGISVGLLLSAVWPEKETRDAVKA
ncbi:MAG TPA: FUSC family protein [Candidatus Baltobacteraceae bacterium]|jgi:uncharacterized membrane protein YgaE (UPF0421/DUF939 family)|nr:FUSC family protein [Candidatus Baltobacteraceae bacterium]